MAPTLLPLYVHPADAPTAWQAAAGAGRALTVVVRLDADDDGRAYAAAMSDLAGAGVGTLGYVDLAYAARPLADLLDDVNQWADYPASGVFLDHAPTSPFCVGPVALAARVARRTGLDAVVLNPGVPPDPLYRDLGTAICGFEGTWPEYRRWSAEGSRPGDLHLVRSVPVAELADARALMRRRGAGGLVTDLPDYTGVPAWLPTLAGTL